MPPAAVAPAPLGVPPATVSPPAPRAPPSAVVPPVPADDDPPWLPALLPLGELHPPPIATSPTTTTKDGNTLALRTCHFALGFEKGIAILFFIETSTMRIS